MKKYLNKLLEILIYLTLVLTPLLFTKTEIKEFSAIRMMGLTLGMGAILKRWMLKQRLINDFFEGGMLIVVMIMAIGIKNGVSPFFSFNYMFTYLAIAFYVYALKTAEIDKDKLLDVSLFAGFLVATAAVFQKLGMQFLYVKFVPSDRLTGTFFNANRLAGYAGLVLLPTLARALRKKALWPLVLLLGAIIVFTKSRGGVVFAFIGLNVFAYLSWRKKRGFVVGWIALNLILATAFFHSPYSSRFKTNLLNDPNVKQRILIWWTAIKMFKDNPVFGSGVGTFSMSFEHYRTPFILKYIKPGDTAFHSHNDYLQFLSEIGVIGFSLLLLALYALVKSKRGKSLEQKAVYAAIFSMLLYELIDFNLHIMPTLILFLTLVFYLSDFRNLSKRSKGGRRYGIAVLFLLLLILQIKNLGFYMASIYFEQGNKFEGRDKERALNLYDRVLKLNPYYDYYYAFAGHTLSDMNKNIKATYYYRIAARLHPHKMSYFANLAVLYFKQGQVYDARKAFERSIEAEPYKPEGWNKFFIINEYLENYATAYLWARKALYYFGDPAAVATIFNCLKNLNYAQERRMQVAKSLFTFNRNLRPEIIGQYKVNFGDKSAYDFVEHGIQVNTADYLLSKETMKQIASIYFANKKYKEALRYYMKAAKEYSDADAYFNAAVCYYYLGDRVNAIKFFNETLKLDPQNEMARNNLKILRK